MLLCQSAQETLLHLLWECPITEAFWNSVQQFFVSVDLIPAFQALTSCQCLGLKGEKSALLFNHCLLLGRFYIYSCKYKNIRPSSIEYVHQLRSNFKIEKHVSIITGTQNAFEKKWRKILQALKLLDLSFEFLKRQFQLKDTRFSFSLKQP